MLLHDDGSRNDPASIHLATKRDTWILNKRPDELGPVQIREHVRANLRDYPGAEIRSCASTYNCAGLVFASRRTNVFPEEFDKIIRDDSYVQIPRLLAEVGDVIVYKGAQDGPMRHVGFVAQVRTLEGSDQKNYWVLSQWGQAGEYFHAESNVPEAYGQITEFYTERVRYHVDTR